MNTKEVIYELRTKNGMSQDELAERFLSQVGLFHDGKTEKLYRILKH